MSGRLAAAVAAVPDPELPMVTIADLGILRRVEVAADGVAEIELTPTYTGCPALAAITTEVAARAAAAGFPGARVRTVLAPPWSTAEITPTGRAKLAAAGIAPPPAARVADRPPGSAGPVPLPQPVRLPEPGRWPGPAPEPPAAPCPRCGSPATRLVSRFGPTACTGLRACAECGEPFEAVKPL